MPDVAGTDERALQRINRRLAELLDVAELPLATGGGVALADTLWVWGVVGGKDVGKSTLINALAGGDVVDRGEDVGEGTIAPTAYLHAGDAAAVASRFAGAGDTGVRFVESAPDTMRGLVLVDLPDFDSLFRDHTSTVRRVARVLDGIIWVTTPKKVGDLRAIDEIDRVLKARTNFAYVVNKMDWLIGQSDRPPPDELDRAADALRRQVRYCDTDDGRTRSFYVSARYRSREAMVDAIAASRNVSAAQLNGAVREAVDTLLRDFDTLRARLTTAPTSDAAEANKRANLAYQLHAQARQVRDHYKINELCTRLERALDPNAVQEQVDHYFPITYCAAVLRRLNGADALFASWSADIFRRRISAWPLLGMVAWPVMALAAAIGGLRAMFPRFAAPQTPDAFRHDGVSDSDRADGLLAGIRSRLAAAHAPWSRLLPDVDEVARILRTDAHHLAEEQREAVQTQWRGRRAGGFGRFLRGLLTWSILLWFPFAQPLLSAGLAMTGIEGAGFTDGLRLLVQGLSGGAVLAGLCVSVLLLAGLTGAVYARAVSDTYRAIDRLIQAAGDAGAETLSAAVVGVATRRAVAVRDELAELHDRLAQLSDADGLHAPESGLESPLTGSPEAK